jgi:hypothetical protein
MLSSTTEYSIPNPAPVSRVVRVSGAMRIFVYLLQLLWQCPFHYEYRISSTATESWLYLSLQKNIRSASLRTGMQSVVPAGVLE